MIQPPRCVEGREGGASGVGVLAREDGDLEAGVFLFVVGIVGGGQPDPLGGRVREESRQLVMGCAEEVGQPGVSPEIGGEEAAVTALISAEDVRQGAQRRLRWVHRCECPRVEQAAELVKAEAPGRNDGGGQPGRQLRAAIGGDREYGGAEKTA